MGRNRQCSPSRILRIDTSRGDVAYNIVDLSEKPADIAAMQEAIMSVDGVLSSRFITGQPGMYYQVNESLCRALHSLALRFDMQLRRLRWRSQPDQTGC
eukprot:COSAG02_NODE_7345_length_3053_cov_9.087339_2_plen_99_part_00